jgi:hypothetical protein
MKAGSISPDNQLAIITAAAAKLVSENKCSLTVFRIRIRVGIRIRVFFSLADPHPDPLVTSTDPDPTLDPFLFL